MQIAKEVGKAALRHKTLQPPSGEAGKDSQDFRDKAHTKPALGALSAKPTMLPQIKSIIKLTKSSPNKEGPKQPSPAQHHRSLNHMTSHIDKAKAMPRAPPKPPEKPDASGEEGKRVLERQYYSADVSAMIEGEKYDHQAYIYGYKVSVCQAWLHGKCPKEDSECFDSHCNPPLRRKPHLQHGRFNYIPTRCRYLTEKEECPQTIHCRFAHCTEEVIYHPSKFRTQLCQNALDARGICEGYGYHCAKAHSEADLRPAVFETMDNPACLYMTMDELSDFVCAPEDQKEERQFYMYVYKTRRCEGYPYNCGCDGLDYHRGHERRRSGVIKYLPMACPNIKPFPKSEWGDPYDDSKCVPVSKPKKERRKREQSNEETGDEEIWDCQYAHTLMEVMYHPQVYKTDLCQHFDESDPAKWRCVWKKRCAHAHGTADLRTKEEAVQEWKAHMGDSVKGRKLPSLVEQIIAAPNMLAKDLAGFPGSTELTKAFAEEFNLRGLEDRKNNQISPASMPFPGSGESGLLKSHSFESLSKPADKPFDLSNNNPPLHNLHVRQTAGRAPPKRLQQQQPPQQPPPQPQPQSQQQQLSQALQQQLLQRLHPKKSTPPPPPPFQPKQQLPAIPPPPPKPETFLASSSLISTPLSSLLHPAEQKLPKDPPLPPPFQQLPTPSFVPKVALPEASLFPPTYPATSELLGKPDQSLSDFMGGQVTPDDVVFPPRRRGSSALEILEERKEPVALTKIEPPADLWKTPPKSSEPQTRPSPPKWVPLFDLGASPWSPNRVVPTPDSPTFETARSQSSEESLLKGIPPTLRPLVTDREGSLPGSSNSSSADLTKVEGPSLLLGELESALSCPFPHDQSTFLSKLLEGRLNLLDDPVSTPCCGLSFCRKCMEKYLGAVDGMTGWPMRCVQMKDKCTPGSASAAYVERESGRCICGHWITKEETDLMLQNGRSNFTLGSVLEIARRYS